MSSEQKSSDRTPIMVSIQLHEKLNTVKEQLRKIIGKKSLSLEKTIEILLTAKPLDVILEDLILEAYPTIIKEPSKKEEKANHLETFFIEFAQALIYPSKLSKEQRKEIHDKLEQILLWQ